MGIEGLFSSSKWEIIEMLSAEELSPLQLSEKLGTSVANVSQQLKLLELVGLVKTRKLPNRERGKPRTLYSLAANFVYVISAMKNFPKKNLIKATPVVAAIVRILCVPDTGFHYPLLKLFWSAEPSIADIDGMVFNPNTSTLVVYSKKSVKLPNQLSLEGKTVHVKVLATLPSRLESGQLPIYDSENRMQGVKT